MINGLIALLIGAFILGLIFWAVDWMGIPQPINKVIKAVIILVGLIFLINFLLSLTGHGGFIRM